MTDIYTTQLDSSGLAHKTMTAGKISVSTTCWRKITCGINIQIPSSTCGVVINGFIQSRQDFLEEEQERRGVNTAMQSQSDRIKTE